MVAPANDSVRCRLPVITNSEQKTFRRCAREHHYAYELGYRSLGDAEAYELGYRSLGDAEALRFGSLFHLGLEQWWKTLHAQQLGTATQTPLEAAIDAMASEAMDEYDLVRAGVLMQGYDLRWRSDDYEVLAVEIQFRAPLINPLTGAASRTYEVAGKLDAVVRRRADDRVCIVEHKTSSEDISGGSPYWQRLTLDTQISIYFAGARSLGFEPVGCLYDVIGKPRHAPLKATPEESRKYTKAGHLYANQRAEDETPDEYRVRLTNAIAENPDRFYQRGEIVRLEDEERDAAVDTWQTARLMREAQVARRYPRNPDGCERYGRTCAFFPVCTGTASLDDPTRFTVVDNVHQELTPDAA